MIQAEEHKRVSLPIEWPYRMILNAIIICVILLLSFATIVIKTDLVKTKIDELSQRFYEYTSTRGLHIDDIIIEGRNKTHIQDIKDIIDIEKAKNILELDINEIKQNVELLPWVRHATVKRTFFPNVLQISIVEREVKAIWQISERFYPIDTEGNVINADFRTDKPILLIVGAKAPENLTKLLEVVHENEALYNRIKVANFISQRRWNLVLDDIKEGITIKMPEENIASAWKKLIHLNDTKGLLKRKLTIIDLRLEDKVIVKLRKSSKDGEVKLNSKKERTT